MINPTYEMMVVAMLLSDDDTHGYDDLAAKYFICKTLVVRRAMIWGKQGLQFVFERLYKGGVAQHELRQGKRLPEQWRGGGIVVGQRSSPQSQRGAGII